MHNLNAKFGALDCVVANAGIAHKVPLAELTDAKWDQTFDVDLKPVIATERWRLEKLRRTDAEIESTFAAVLAASGLPADKCEVYKLMLGTGFGRRTRSDYVGEAVKIARQMPGTPIKLLWSREEDMAQGRYHPIMQCKLVGAFDKDNNLTGLHMRLSGQSILASVRPQVLVRLKIQHASHASSSAESPELCRSNRSHHRPPLLARAKYFPIAPWLACARSS